MDDTLLIVYTLTGEPVSYMGELVSDDGQKIVLKRALVLQIRQNKNGDEFMTIGVVPFASRDSTVTLYRSSVPGVLVTNVDPELKDHYNKEILSSYSKLKLA